MTLLHSLRRLSGRGLRAAAERQLRVAARLSRPPGPGRAPYRLKNGPSSADRLVMHFNGNFTVGGSTQLIVDLIELSSDAWRHEVVVPHLPDPVPYQPVSLHPFSLERMEGLRALLEERRPVLAHVHYWSRAENRFDATGIWYATVLAMCEALGIPVVQNVNVPTRPMAGPAVRRNVYVSRYVLDHFDGGAAPSQVIHPGSDFTHFVRRAGVGAGGGEAPDTIGMVYRLDADKLNERSIEPFLLVARARPSTRCIIVGEGSLGALFRARVREEGLGDRFEFAGMVSYAALPDLYARMGVFVAPVHNESFGQVTPFAMNMGLPVAGYEVGALGEILGSTATLARPGDEAALAGLVLDLLGDPERRRALGAANRQRASSLFSREAMVEHYRRAYAEVAPAPAGRA